MTSSDVSLNIVEIRKPEVDAKLVARALPTSSSAASRSAAP
jgi:ribosomal protein S3